MATKRNHAEQVYYGAQCAFRNFLGFSARDARIRRLHLIELAATIHTDCHREKHEDCLGYDYFFSDGSSLRINRDSSCSFNVNPPPRDYAEELAESNKEASRSLEIFKDEAQKRRQRMSTKAHGSFKK